MKFAFKETYNVNNNSSQISLQRVATVRQNSNNTLFTMCEPGHDVENWNFLNLHGRSVVIYIMKSHLSSP